MRRYSITSGIIAGSLCLMLVAATTTAQQTQTQERQRQRANQIDRQRPGRLAKQADAMNIRASKLIGMNIHNATDEGVGEVNDIVLDANTGRIRYLAVTYGGFLGVGDKLFAVPFEAFQCRTDPANPAEHQLVLDVSQQQLEGAQGFDEENWPDFADRKFTAELDKRYKVRRPMRNRDVDVDVNRNGLDIDVDSKKPADQREN